MSRNLLSVLISVLNVKAVVAPLKQEKALVGAFSVIKNLRMDLRFKLYYILSLPTLNFIDDQLFRRLIGAQNIRTTCG